VTTNTPNARRLAALLRRLGACHEGAEWASGRDLETAWNECPRGDWLLWLAGRLEIERTVLARAAARCAETALQYVPAGEDRPRQAIEAVLRWADDPTAANLEAVRVARRNAVAVAAYAAYAAAYAAAASAAYAAYASAASAYAYAYAASTASAARQQAQQRHAEIVREHIPFALILDAAQRRELGGAS